MSDLSPLCAPKWTSAGRSSLWLHALAASDLPDGSPGDLPVQSRSQKYSHSLLTQITCISSAVPPHSEGRFAIVTDVGAGCGGRKRRIDEGAWLADGEVVWF